MLWVDMRGVGLLWGRWPRRLTDQWSYTHLDPLSLYAASAAIPKPTLGRAWPADSRKSLRLGGVMHCNLPTGILCIGNTPMVHNFGLDLVSWN